MTHTFEELSKMTVAQLREVASEIEGLTGTTQMRKQEVLDAICHALGIDQHVHHEVVGINKRSVKRQIKALKVERDKALDAHDSVALKKVRREIHHLKRKLHKATV